MSALVLKGTIVSAPAFGQLDITEQGFLVLEDGVIQGIYPVLPTQYAHAPLEDYGSCLLLQSLADLHLHAPQYPMLGTGMDLPLLSWLDTRAFPTEARFADPDYARTFYRQLAKDLIANGTTRVCMFSSLHRQSTLILMEELEKAGVTGYVGKVNMDRRGGAALQETTEESQRETLLWLEECGQFSHIQPILTPRFIPSCSEELLTFLGTLAAKRDLPIQSHLSENLAEMELVRTLHPDCTQYWEAYAKYGLWNHRTAMAHCVWSDQREREAMAKAGVLSVHCAASNNNLCSGIAPLRALLREGVRVALGSDIAGGDQLAMTEVIAATLRASKNRRILDNWQTEFLTAAEGWYLATSSSADWFGLHPGFAVGDRLHAIVLDDAALPGTDTLSVPDRLERCIYHRQPGAIRAVWSDGEQILG